MYRVYKDYFTGSPLELWDMRDSLGNEYEYVGKVKKYVKLKSKKILTKKEAIDIFRNRLKPELKKNYKSLWGKGKTWLFETNQITRLQYLKW